MKAARVEKNHNTFVWAQVPGEQEWEAACFIGKLRVTKSDPKVGWLMAVGKRTLEGAALTRREAQKIVEGVARHMTNTEIFNARMKFGSQDRTIIL